MNLSHEEYLKQFQQSRLLAEQRTNLYGPFNTVPMGMPGGNNQIGQSGDLQITVDTTEQDSLNWKFNSSAPTTFTIDWGEGEIEEFEIDESDIENSGLPLYKGYNEARIWNVIITFDDPSLIIKLDFNDD